jgi:hypothetical protein
MKTTPFTLLVATLLFVPLSKSFSQAVDVNDSLALVDLYDSTNGAGWLFKWTLSSPVATWHGVAIDNSGRVTNLILDNNKLTGIIPTSIGNLKKLTKLELATNQLTGNIPVEIGNIDSLQVLDLSRNQLTGSIPTSIGNLSAMTTLNLEGNQLTGIIPSEIGNLTSATSFKFASNQITGDIPSSLGNLSKLQILWLENNRLTGSLPSELGNLSNLQQLALERNQLTGDIPASFGNLSQIQLLTLHLNQLSGYLPASLANISNAFSGFSIWSNKFTFAGLEQLATINHLSYSPQANIPLYNQNNTLSVAAGGTPSNDTFRLYRNGVLDTMQIEDSTFPITTTGKYNIVITNSVATKLTLYTDTLDIVALPITLTSFTATKKQASALLNWQTANEQNNAYFIVERSNSSNTKFVEVGRVNSKGNSNHLQQYSFEDLSPFGGANYYRLTQVDRDAKSTYSKVVFVNFGKTTTIKLYPNPVKDIITLEGLNGTTNISIVSLEGSILTKTIANSDTYTWNIKQLPAGTYYIRIEAGKNVTTLKFIKE